MKNTALCLAVATLAGAPLSAQDILHYKFDANCGTDVINYAENSVVGSGTMNSSLPGAPASSWTTGRIGTAMTGSTKGGATAENFVDTGWNIGTLTGSFSISMWIRNKPGNPTSISFGYLFGASGGSSFRCFTGASGKLFVGGLVSGNLVNANDLTTKLNAGYVHVALVVDAPNNTATYYIDGVADAPITLSGTPTITGTDFRVGKYRTSSGSPMDIDEFLFTRRVLSLGDVTLLAGGPQAGAGMFGTGNQGTLTPGGGRPSLGSPTFRLTIADGQATSYLLYVGSNRCSLGGGLTLPADLGTVIPPFSGVNAYTDIDLFVFSGALSGGQAVLGLPVPNLPPLIGFATYWQAYTITAQNALRGTNAVAISPGF